MIARVSRVIPWVSYTRFIGDLLDVEFQRARELLDEKLHEEKVTPKNGAKFRIILELEQ